MATTSSLLLGMPLLTHEDGQCPEVLPAGYGKVKAEEKKKKSRKQDNNSYY